MRCDECVKSQPRILLIFMISVIPSGLLLAACMGLGCLPLFWAAQQKFTVEKIVSLGMVPYNDILTAIYFPVWWSVGWRSFLYFLILPVSVMAFFEASNLSGPFIFGLCSAPLLCWVVCFPISLVAPVFAVRLARKTRFNPDHPNFRPRR
jgi:hypothetical protein